MEKFLSDVYSHLSKKDADGVAAVAKATASNHPMAVKWQDLNSQLRNAVAAERARKMEKDPSKWIRPVQGCSLFWKNRIVASFNEKDPESRERLIEAAGELTPVTAPLSVEALFTYAIRLAIVVRRSKMNVSEGNAVFDRLTLASSPEALFKEEEK